VYLKKMKKMMLPFVIAATAVIGTAEAAPLPMPMPLIHDYSAVIPTEATALFNAVDPTKSPGGMGFKPPYVLSSPGWIELDPASITILSALNAHMYAPGGYGITANELGYDNGSQAVLQFNARGPSGPFPPASTPGIGGIDDIQGTMINLVSGPLDLFYVQPSFGPDIVFWTDPGKTGVPSGLPGVPAPPVEGVDYTNGSILDAKNHFLSFLHLNASDGNDYLVYLYDEGGGDFDYADNFILINLKPGGGDHLVDVPEPGTYLMLGTFLAAAAVSKKRRRLNVKKAK